MRSQNEHNDSDYLSGYRELQILSEVEASPEITQRELSQRAGIALGLTNALMRNLVKKGYIRASKAGFKRWLYAVTPQGFSHKIRLTVAYVRRVLDDYKKVRQTLRDELAPLALHEESRVAIVGIGGLAELVYLGLKDLGIEEISVFDQTDSPGDKFLGMPVRDIGTLQPSQYDSVVIAALSDSESILRCLKEHGVTLENPLTFFPDGSVKNGVKETV